MIPLLAPVLLLTGSPAQDTLRRDLPISIKRDATYWKWRDLPWTAEDRQIIQARKQIDELAEKRQSGLSQLEQIAINAKKQFEAAPKPETRPLIIWTYAAFCVSAIDARRSGKVFLSRAINYLEKVKPIASYEYARTRFLAMSDTFPKQYLPVGKRLLQRDPKDFLVNFYFVRLLDVVDSDQAKRACAELIQKWPDKPNVYALMGTIYYLADFTKPNKEDLRTAKKYFEIFLQKAPSSNSNVKMVKWRLQNIEKKLSGG